MNDAAILGLLCELWENVVRLQRENARLREHLNAQPPPPPPKA